MNEIIFDQYQRYKNAQRIINSIRKSDEKLNILEVGANKHKNLENFLKNDNVTYLDIELPEEFKEDPQYILGDATNMDFEDKSYDIVVALDVYEHIPKEKREDFIKEVYRVCKKVAIISAPFDEPGVASTEKRANEFYRLLIGTNHLWLNEHIVNGIPNLEKLKEFLNSNNINYTSFSHGNLLLWEKMNNVRCLLDVDKGLTNYIYEIDKYYNNFIFEKDYVQNGYRNFIILEKEEKFNLDFNENNSIDIKHIEELIENVYRLFSIRKSIGVITERLPVYGDNILKVYIDYGDGYNEKDIIYKMDNLYSNKKYIFNEFNGNKVKSVRIDPSELSGKVLLRNIVLKDKHNNLINEFTISSNSKYKEGDLFIFISEDPQIILDFEEVELGTVEFELKKLEGYDKKEDIISEVILDKIGFINRELQQIHELQEKNIVKRLLGK